LECALRHYGTALLNSKKLGQDKLQVYRLGPKYRNPGNSDGTEARIAVSLSVQLQRARAFCTARNATNFFFASNIHEINHSQTV
jgi:hypothetical protein